MEENKEFISSGILLEMARDEYTKERERANALDNKASFFITVIVAVATIFVPIIPFGKIVPLYKTGLCVQKCFASVLLAGIIISVFILAFAFKKLYDAYKLTDYMRPNLDVIDDLQFHFLPTDKVEKGMSDHYKTVVDDNIAVNGKKCKSITLGIKLCGVGFMILIVTTIGLIITIGG